MPIEPMLPSWEDSPTTRAIVDFVEAVTTEGRSTFLPVDERISVFDNDGTLWAEKPMPIQLDFLIRRFAEQAEKDASLRGMQPYKAARENDLKWFGDAMTKHYEGDDSVLKLLVSAVNDAYARKSIDEYRDAVDAFFGRANHPTLRRPYLSLYYEPMVELLAYLTSRGFTNYIASGGDRDFMRAIADALYGISPEHVIGSTAALEYQEGDDGVDVIYKSEMEFFDDGPVKPVRIWSRIGRRPVIAVGNSNGDVPMLEFARVPNGTPLRMLIVHDDAEREFDYTAGAEKALERARSGNWTLVSMQNDWSKVFIDEMKARSAAA